MGFMDQNAPHLVIWSCNMWFKCTLFMIYFWHSWPSLYILCIYTRAVYLNLWMYLQKMPMYYNKRKCTFLWSNPRVCNKTLKYMYCSVHWYEERDNGNGNENYFVAINWYDIHNAETYHQMVLTLPEINMEASIADSFSVNPGFHIDPFVLKL